VSGQHHAPAASIPGKDLVPIVQKAGWVQGRSGRAENLVPTEIRSRTVQPVAQTLYRLSYPTHLYVHKQFLKLKYDVQHPSRFERSIEGSRRRTEHTSLDARGNDDKTLFVCESMLQHVIRHT